jgi:RimJ/RimL family protein N-acetyltransferase
MAVPCLSDIECRTQRLILRRPRAGDIDAVFAIHGDPETNRFNPAGPMQTLDQADTVLSGWRAHWDAQGFGYWAISAIDAPNHLIGFGGIVRKALDGRATLNLYFRFRPEAWSKGYASELASAALKLAFETLGEKEVVGIVRRDNAPSIKALQRTGLKLAGEIDDVPPREPSLIFAIAADDYRRRLSADA